jgi:endonuclease YncB( thermonuclease family)
MAALRRWLQAAAVLLLPATATDAAACDLKPKPSEVAVRVIDGETVALDNGDIVRLAGVLAPRPLPGADPGADWPAASAARAALESMVTGQKLFLASPSRKPDRYGRLVAHAFIGEAERRRWVEAELARMGYVRVSPPGASRECVAGLLAAEREARKARRGLWAEAAYQIKDAGKPQALLDSELRFELVEGLVHRVSASRSGVFIEFGKRWREDFTVLIRGRDRQAMAKAGIDLALLAGRRIRVRGFIERRNGPFLRVTVPEQIELLDPAP